MQSIIEYHYFGFLELAPARRSFLLYVRVSYPHCKKSSHIKFNPYEDTPLRLTYWDTMDLAVISNYTGRRNNKAKVLCLSRPSKTYFLTYGSKWKSRSGLSCNSVHLGFSQYNDQRDFNGCCCCCSEINSIICHEYVTLWFWRCFVISLFCLWQ